MSAKKHMGSKLAQGVRQVQSERGQQPASSKIVEALDEAGLVKDDTPPAPVTGAPLVNTQAAATLQPDEKAKQERLHPKRVWPD